MPKELVISAAPHETRVAILEDGQLCEIYIEREKEFALVGSIYKGRVTRVLPGMQSAFVDIGLDSDAFLYVGDFLENLEDYDHVVSPAENKIEKMEQQGGSTFVQPTSVEAEGHPAPPEGSSASSAASGFAGGESASDDDAQPQSSAFESGSGQSDDADSDGPQPGNIADQRSSQQQPRAGQSNPTSRYSPPGQSLPGQSAPPRTPFGRQDRGPSNTAGQGRGNDRGSDRGGDRGNDRGNDRGGRRRGGRWRRGGGRDNQARPGGRDLPQSKYASTSPSAPRPFTPRPYEPPPPAEDLPADFEPIILPGESLAKYKDRTPGSGQTSGQPSAPSSLQAPAASHSSAGSIAPSQSTEVKGPVSDSGLPGLPTSLYASPAETPQVPRVSEHGTIVPSSVVPSVVVPSMTPSSKQHSEFAPVHEQQPAHAAETSSSLPAGTAELTDDEATALAEQLAEARQEEASAEAETKLGTGRRFDEDAPPPPESAAETDEFIAEVREQEEEDADKEHEIAHQAAQAGEDAHEQSFSSESEQEDDDEAMPGNEAQPESDAELAADSGNESESDQALADHAQALADQIGNVAPTSQQDRPQTSARIGGQPNRARFQRPMRRGGRQRSGSGGGGGHRPQRQHDSRHQQAQRRPQLISEMLKAGQEILVQIAKEPLGKKGARITSHVALPGRFLVYMPTVNHIGVSRRIGSADERSRLRRLVTEAKGTFPGGFIVRTAAEGAPDDEIRADVEFLGRTWEKTLSQAEPRKAPSLLHRDLNLVERILRDYVSNDYTAIWINNQEEYSKVVEFVSRFQPKLVDRVKLYTKSTPIFEEFGIQQELDKALRPKVWLKSGGYIVINHTEALVAIDVNTGKYVGRGSTRLEDTIVKTNLEAVKEIVRQIRLRDLGGIIILDFIDMEERRNRDKVMAALDSALRADRAPSKALSFNEFGLVAVTRKRTKQALERVLCQPCPYCTGSGMVKSVPTICYEIQAEARKMSPDLDASSLTLRVHPEIAKTLKTREAALIEELEQITRKSVIIQADPTLHWEQYDIY